MIHRPSIAPATAISAREEAFSILTVLSQPFYLFFVQFIFVLFHPIATTISKTFSDYPIPLHMMKSVFSRFFPSDCIPSHCVIESLRNFRRLSFFIHTTI